MKNIEVEIRGLLSLDEYNKLNAFLSENAFDKEIDDRETTFFIMQEQTLKVSHQISKEKAKIVLKTGDIVKSISQTEYELNISPKEFQTAVEIFKHLGFLKIQNTSQKRINYSYKDCCISVKWSEDWGYHFEIDKEIDETQSKAQARAIILKIAKDLNISVMTEEEFGRRCEEINRKHNTII